MPLFSSCRIEDDWPSLPTSVRRTEGSSTAIGRFGRSDVDETDGYDKLPAFSMKATTRQNNGQGKLVLIMACPETEDRAMQRLPVLILLAACAAHAAAKEPAAPAPRA